jgi:hypothetical protein
MASVFDMNRRMTLYLNDVEVTRGSRVAIEATKNLCETEPTESNHWTRVIAQSDRYRQGLCGRREPPCREQSPGSRERRGIDPRGKIEIGGDERLL